METTRSLLDSGALPDSYPHWRTRSLEGRCKTVSGGSWKGLLMQDMETAYNDWDPVPKLFI